MDIDPLIFILYCLIGIFAGLSGGLLGLGGGIVIVPCLYFLFQWQGFPSEHIMHLAVATSLLTIIFTSISSTWAHHKHKAVLWSEIRFMLPGIIIGTATGSLITDLLHSNNLRVLFGLFEILVAIQIWLQLKPESARSLPEKSGLIIMGAFIGCLSTILGIGGGTITVPLLLLCGINIRNAVATSSACGLPIAVFASVGLMTLGWHETDLPENSLGYVYWPAAIGIIITSIFFAPVGARMAHRLKVETLRKTFAVVVFLVGIRMLA